MTPYWTGDDTGLGDDMERSLDAGLMIPGDEDVVRPGVAGGDTGAAYTDSWDCWGNRKAISPVGSRVGRSWRLPLPPRLVPKK